MAKILPSLHDFFLAVSRDNQLSGFASISKFGRNPAVGTTYVPIALGGVYRTPQVGGATALRVKAGGGANDTASGSGARSVTFIGTDATGAEVTDTVATAGALASAASTVEFMRLYRAFVSASGTYATQSAGSHAADITIEDAAGTQDWATITTSSSTFPRGQTEIGAYTVPTGYKAFITEVDVYSNSAKTTDVLFFRRENILETAAPYTAMRELFEVALEGGHYFRTFTPPIKVTGPADVGFLAKVDATTAEVTATFDLVLVQED